MYFGCREKLLRISIRFDVILNSCLSCNGENINQLYIYIYIYMYHFHTSDQRVKPVHISYIALVLEC